MNTTTTSTITTTTETTTTTTTLAEVSINKVDLEGEEVVGALLSLNGTDANGNTVTFESSQLKLGKDAKGVTSTGEKLVWYSGTEATIVKVQDGTYTLHELAAPNGYEKATDITFTVKNGKVVVILASIISTLSISTTLPFFTVNVMSVAFS